MATRSLGALTIDLIAKTSGFVEGWTKAEREADRAQKKIAADAKKNAKETEEASLYRDMRNDLVQQIMRRLAAIKPVLPAMSVAPRSAQS